MQPWRRPVGTGLLMFADSLCFYFLMHPDERRQLYNSFKRAKTEAVFLKDVIIIMQEEQMDQSPNIPFEDSFVFPESNLSMIKGRKLIKMPREYWFKEPFSGNEFSVMITLRKCVLGSHESAISNLSGEFSFWAIFNSYKGTVGNTCINSSNIITGKVTSEVLDSLFKKLIIVKMEEPRVARVSASVPINEETSTAPITTSITGTTTARSFPSTSHGDMISVTPNMTARSTSSTSSGETSVTPSIGTTRSSSVSNQDMAVIPSTATTISTSSSSNGSSAGTASQQTSTPPITTSLFEEQSRLNANTSIVLTHRSEETFCVICYENDDLCLKFPCRHRVCWECIYKQGQVNREGEPYRCPYCRRRCSPS